MDPLRLDEEMDMDVNSASDPMEGGREPSIAMPARSMPEILPVSRHSTPDQLPDGQRGAELSAIPLTHFHPDILALEQRLRARHMSHMTVGSSLEGNP
jgi:hypothetical protein